MRFDHARHTRGAVISVRMSIWCMIDVTISGSARARVEAVCLTCGCIVVVRRGLFIILEERESEAMWSITIVFSCGYYIKKSQPHRSQWWGLLLT